MPPWCDFLSASLRPRGTYSYEGCMVSWTKFCWVMLGLTSIHNLTVALLVDTKGIYILMEYWSAVEAFSSLLVNRPNQRSESQRITLSSFREWHSPPMINEESFLRYLLLFRWVEFGYTSVWPRCVDRERRRRLWPSAQHPHDDGPDLAHVSLVYSTSRRCCTP